MCSSCMRKKANWNDAMDDGYVIHTPYLGQIQGLFKAIIPKTAVFNKQ